MKYKTHKGIAYFPNYIDARQVAREVGGIVRNYIRGYAVQYYISGPYYPENKEN